MGCLRIPFSRGVCGAAARENKTQWVPDVHQFPGHIACDDVTRSECVIPLRDHSGEVRGVLDLDSPHLSGFDPQEATFCENLLQEVFSRPVRW
jgi:GAF domain-containing protein